MAMVEQRQGVAAVQPWILSRAGEVLAGQDHDRRLAQMRAGLVRHPAVVPLDADVAAEDVAGALDAVHEPAYLRALRDAPAGAAVLMAELAAPGMAPDTPVCADVARAAFEGVRTAIAAARAVLAGERFAYALCRPPGHHAGPGWLGGCCYLNNAAAAAYTLREGGVAEVAILDLDIHYPNGTAAIVARMRGVSLHSLHAWPVVNVPARSALPCAPGERVVEFRRPPGEADYLDALAGSLDEAVRSAGVIVLSLGYDTVAGDPHGCWAFAPATFARIGALLAGAGLPVCVVQEGGYALASLADCSHQFAVGLLDGGPPGRAGDLAGRAGRLEAVAL